MTSSLISSRARVVGVVVLGAALSCVELPLEHTNYFDPWSETRLEITGVPDTINSIHEVFVPTVVSKPRIPKSAPDLSWTVVEGIEVLMAIGDNQFRSQPTIGLIPVTARLRVTVPGSLTPPSAEKTIVLRQRPVVADLQCAVTEDCETVGALQAIRTVIFELRDSLAFPVNLPTGDFRYGTVLSRAPGVVSVQGRPSATSILIRSEAAGSAWIVLIGEGSVTDSLQVTVVP